MDVVTPSCRGSASAQFQLRPAHKLSISWITKPLLLLGTVLGPRWCAQTQQENSIEQCQTRNTAVTVTMAGFATAFLSAVTQTLDQRRGFRQRSRSDRCSTPGNVGHWSNVEMVPDDVTSKHAPGGHQHRPWISFRHDSHGRVIAT